MYYETIIDDILSTLEGEIEELQKLINQTNSKNKLTKRLTKTYKELLDIIEKTETSLNKQYR